MKEFNAYGNKIEVLEDGGIRVQTPDGKVIELDKNGHIKVNLDTIKSVGFENIFDLKSHVIMRQGDFTIHKAEYHDGGKVEISFTADGKLKKFECVNIIQTITKENEIVIKSRSSAK